ncbi:MAG: hypothetical protein K2O42_00210, partial [Oscillospiraceae bacterium]|nr:hypothetical protein [Oscillospiraceae bacterium]
ELEVPDEEEETDSDNFLKKIFKKNSKNYDKNDAGEDATENSGTETTTDTQENSEETKNSENSENTENSETTVSENSAESSAEENNTGSENSEMQGENPDANTGSDPQNQNTDPSQDASQETDPSQDASDENTDPNSETPNETIPEATEPSAADPDALTVLYQGYIITIGGDATAFVNAVKPLEEPLKAPSCYGDGDDVVYTYDGMTLTTLREADREIVRNVDITSPGIAPVEGYDVGMTADFKGEKKIFSPNGSVIIITEIGGVVEYISYNIA